MFPPLKRVYVDLENRRRRVEELEGHIPVLKKQMARAIKGGKSDGVDTSSASSDINYLRGERDKLLEQNDGLTKKYDKLYRDYCVLSMSNEALVRTNTVLLQDGSADQAKTKTSKTRAPRKRSATRKITKAKAPNK